MNALDKAIAWFAPKLALDRARARAALSVVRGYDGAKVGKRTGPWVTSSSSANSEIATGGKTLRARARDLVRNTPHAARIVDVAAAHVVGTGIRPIFSAGSKLATRRVREAWRDWEEQADAAGWSFPSAQELAVRSMVEAGECLVRLVSVKPSGRSTLPLRVAVMECDQIDDTKDRAALGQSGARLGIELDRWRKPTGYWLYDDNPQETPSVVRSQLVAADDVCHVFRRLRPDQVRGVSWLAPVILAARDIADLQEAVIVKARIEACFAGMITSPETESSAFTPGDVREEDGKRITALSPGKIFYLQPGEDVKFASPTPSPMYEPVMQHTLRAIAAGAGLTYDQVTGDLTQANYSSLRAGKIEFRRLIEQLQWGVVIPRLCTPVVERFIAFARMGGIIREGVTVDVSWVTPANEPIDPKKDLEADIMAVRAGRMTPQEFIAGWGRDPEEVVSGWSDFIAQIDAAGLVFDIDPRRRSQSGQATTSGTGAADAPADPATPPP